MADKDEPKTVERELLASATYLDGQDHYRGAVIKLTEEQAARLDDLGHTAEVGTLEKLEDAKRKAAADEAERAAEAERLADEDAHRREALARDQLEPEAESDTASSDGPRVETRSSSRRR